MLWCCPCFSRVGGRFVSVLWTVLCLSSLCPLKCLVGAIDVCDVGGGGSLVGASDWSCCIIGGFVRYWARFCSTSYVPSAL